MPKQSWPEQNADNTLNRDANALTPAQTHSSSSSPWYSAAEEQESGVTRKEPSTVYPSVTNSVTHPVGNSTRNRSPLVVPPSWYQNRRGKAAATLTLIWGGTISLHFVSWGIWLIVGLTGLLSIQALRLFWTRSQIQPEPLPSGPEHEVPFVSLMVAAKNEEAVIANLVKNLCNLDYPSDCYELWVIDDHSTDQTPVVLEKLAQEYSQLKVLRRCADAGGGKSGALNQALPLTKGEILGVFDADAQVQPDLLRYVVPMFNPQQVGAVQVRKAIANATENFWTRSQAAEMALDAYFQRQRISCGGIGELRGNGQFVRREALEHCGGWNEETITDDLDLTIRLHLDQWDVEFLSFPAVDEEGVTHFKALWHQRNRWAEGGYQRYLDYWPLIIRNRMGTKKTIDLLGFWITQYILPTAAVPDLMLSLVQKSLPITTPLTFLTVTLSLFGMFFGLRRISTTEPKIRLSHPASETYPKAIAWKPLETLHSTPEASESWNPSSGDVLDSSGGREGKFQVPTQSVFTQFIQTVRGTVYMLHWLVVVGSTTTRISLRSKRLKWVKTVHQGTVN